jgi:hypothetical protein
LKSRRELNLSLSFSSLFLEISLKIVSGAVFNQFIDNQFFPIGIIGVEVRNVSHKPCNDCQIVFQTCVCFIAKNNKNQVTQSPKNMVNNQEIFNIVESNFIFINHNKSKSVHEICIHVTSAIFFLNSAVFVSPKYALGSSVQAQTELFNTVMKIREIQTAKLTKTGANNNFINSSKLR